MLRYAQVTTLDRSSALFAGVVLYQTPWLFSMIQKPALRSFAHLLLKRLGLLTVMRGAKCCRPLPLPHVDANSQSKTLARAAASAVGAMMSRTLHSQYGEVLPLVAMLTYCMGNIYARVSTAGHSPPAAAAPVQGSAICAVQISINSNQTS